MQAIIVFSHLRWDFVYQRPQQLLSRLARHFPVLYIEEPVFEHGCEPWMECTEPAPGVTVCRPHTPVAAAGFHDDQLPALRELVRELAGPHDGCIAWLYTPMALPLLQEVKSAIVVYDCMDELSAFRFAPRQLTQRESALMHVANIVFTGGPSLFRAKRDRHPNAHCFISSVEAADFQAGRDRAREHPHQASLPGPRLGFYGVLDERFDIDLLAAVADARPDWQIVLVGPVVKIDPAQLPRRPNIHYYGKREYSELAAFMAGWDVCLLPFALNESTRYISPTKVLEYMAAEKPIVSTPITDVAEPYGHVVAIADTAEAFVAACEAALREDETTRAHRIAEMGRIVASTSWDATVTQMLALIDAAYVEQPSQAARALLEGAQPAATDIAPVTAAPHYPVVIAGAGPTGLSAAYHLGADALLLERNAKVGGWCRSIEDHGFTFDYAGHIMFSGDAYVLSLYEKLLGDNMHWQDREAWIYSKNVYTRYPFQGALYGLPPEVLSECIVGAIEARFGSLDGKAAPPADEAPKNFEEFIYRVWGAGVAKHFAIPYNQKLWAVPLSEMETSWLGGRVPMPDLRQMIEGALQPVAKPMGPNARFGYPLRGGFQALMDAFLPHIAGRVECNAHIARVSPTLRTVFLADGRRFAYDQLISTLPLPRLIDAMGEEVPEHVRRAAQGLRHVSVRCVNIGVARTDVTDKHWIYYPEDTVFHRIFVQGNASPHCNAPGGFGLTCEITYSPAKPLPCDGDELIARCIRDCIKVGLIREDDEILVANQVDMPIAYVVYDHARADNVKLIREWLATQDIVLAGRYAEWEYYNSDHAFIAGKRAAEAVSERAAAAPRALPAGAAG